jgi:hypothetical protein
LRFLQAFMPDASPSWHPNDPSDVLGAPPGATLAQLTQFLQARPGLAYTLYFSNNASGPPYHAMLCYCEDGALILGLSGNESAPAARALLDRLEAHAGSKGYWSIEEAPPASAHEFTTRARQREPV